MKKILLNLVCILLLVGVVTGCGEKKEDSGKNSGNNTSENGGNNNSGNTDDKKKDDTSTPEGRLAIAGLKIEDIKPEHAFDSLENGDDTYDVNIFMEKSSDIDKGAVEANRKAIFDKLYNAIKATSDDNKVYEVYYGLGDATETPLPTENPEAENWGAMLFIVQWSYQKDGQWITVTAGALDDRRAVDLKTMDYYDAPAYTTLSLDFNY